MATIRNLLLRLGVDVDPVDKGFARAAKVVDKFDRHFSKVMKVGAGGALFGGAVGGATALSAALAPAAGALVALPGAMAASKVAAGTLKVGLLGVSEAMSAVAEGDAKKLNEALKELSPNARAFVRASGGFLTAFDPVKRAVQDRLFQGLSSQIKPITGNLLPTVKTGMVGVAGGLNGMAMKAAQFAQTDLAKGAVAKIFGTTKSAINTLSGAVNPFLTAITKLTIAGLPLVQRMAGWAAQGAKAAAAFVNTENGAARLTNWAKRAGDTLEQLGRIGLNAIKGLLSVFGAAKTSGDGVLDTLEQMTAKFATWTASAGGQERLREGFQLLLEILRQIVNVLPIFMGPLAAISNILTSMSPEVRGVVTQFLAFSLVGVALAGKLSGLLGVVKGVSVAAVGAGGAVLKFGQGLIQGSAALGQNAGAAAKAGAAVRTFGGYISTGFTATMNAVTGLSSLAGAYAKTALASAGAAAKTLIFEAASKVMAVGTKLWAAAQWLLNAAMKANPIGIIITIIAALIAIVVTAYQKNETFRKIVQAVWKGIQAAISYAWNNIIKPVLQALWNFIVNTLAPKFLWFHNTIVVPVFRKVGQFISTAWNSVIKPIFTTLANFITKTVPDAFKNGVAAIGRFWDKVKAIAKAPVTFMVNTIYNNGIRRIWNWVADKVGLGQLPEIRGFATGGPIRQGTTGTADDVLIRASRGEYMVNAASTKRNAGLIDYVNRFGRNKDILKESGFAGDPGGLGIPGFQEGGIIGWVKGFISKGKDFFLNGFMKAAKVALNPIVNLARSNMGGTGFGSMLAGAVNKIVQGVLDKFKPLETKLGGGGGGKVVQAARRQIGVPYSWGGGGPGGPSYGIGRGAGTKGFDCSGLTEYAWHVATGRSIGGTTYAQKGILQRISGPRPGAVGQPHPGHTYLATEKGTIIEAPFTGGFVREVGMRNTPWWGWPSWASATMDEGGSIRPGWNPPIWNGTGKMEGVFTADMIKAMAGGNRGGNTYHLQVNVAPGTSPAETGRQIVGFIREYERTNGTSWRGFK